MLLLGGASYTIYILQGLNREIFRSLFGAPIRVSMRLSRRWCSSVRRA